MMKKLINPLKNVTIVFLVVLCITQTVRLWFEDFASHNFFASFFSPSSGHSASEAMEGLMRPYRIAVPSGDGFALLYDSASQARLKAQGDVLLPKLMKSGDFASGYTLAYEKFFSGGIVYEYAFPMMADVFGQFFQARTGFLSNRFRTFDAVALHPVEGSDDMVRVVFADYTAGVCYEYTIDSADAAADLRGVIATQPAPAVLYRSTAIGEWKTQFDKHMFFADWGKGALAYEKLRTFSPYGEITITNIEKFVSGFFDNPGGVVWDNDNDVLTYKGENAVAKYYPNNVLEYANYKANQGSVTNSFASAYTAAIGILKKDKGILNEYYLASYAQVGESWFFSFNYVVDGFPVFLSQNVSQSLWRELQQSGVAHMIEVEVQYDKVKKYKRYGLAFETDDTVRAAKRTGFFQTIENALEGTGHTDEDALLPIQEAMFGYREDGSGQLSLHWLIYDLDGVQLPVFD